MNTNEFVQSFAAAYGVTINDANIWARAIFEHLANILPDTPHIKLANLGTFSHMYMESANRWDPNEKKVVKMPAYMTLSYKMSKQLHAKMRALPAKPEHGANKRKHNLPCKDSNERGDERGTQDAVQQDYESGVAFSGESAECGAEE